MSKEETVAPYREVTTAAVVLGVLQGCVMTMAFVYAGLKLGFTLPGSTIAAIMGFALLKGVLGKGTIVENNINQTIASGVNISSAGIVFTLPVLFIMMKSFDPTFVIMAAIGGSFLGVAIIIPLRKQMIDFDRLRFPSGTAVAAILKSPGAGREKAILLLVGFVLSGGMYLLTHTELLPEPFNFGSYLNMPDYMQAAISLSLLNVGAGLLAGRGGLSFFFGGCLAYFVIGPIGVNMGMSAGVPQEQLEGFVYFQWLRPMGIGMLIGGALMGVVMAFPSIKSAIKSLASASKTKGDASQDELSIKVIIGGFIGAFVILFCGAMFGVQDDTFDFYKGSFKNNSFTSFPETIHGQNDAQKYLASHLSQSTRDKSSSGLAKMQEEQTAAIQLKNQELTASNAKELEAAKAQFANLPEDKQAAEIAKKKQYLADALTAQIIALEKEQQKATAHYMHKLQKKVILELNAILVNPDFAKLDQLGDIKMPAETAELLQSHEKEKLSGRDLKKLNRRVVEAVYPEHIQVVADEGSKQPSVGGALLIAVAATLWLALAGIIVAQCTGITDISPLSGLSLIAVTLILALSSNSILAAVMLGVAVCIATAQCADMMQDLKTGYLIGGIPRKQQYVQIGVAWLGPFIAIATLYLLDSGPGFGPGTDLPAPQAGALHGLIEGVIGGNVPIDKYVCGGIFGGFLSLLPGGGIGVLVGLAMYLPFYITMGYGVGCFTNMALTKIKGSGWVEEKIVPLAAGLIVGEALIGLGLAIFEIFKA